MRSKVLQGEVVLIEVTLTQTLYDHNVHRFHPPLTVETTPAGRERREKAWVRAVCATKDIFRRFTSAVFGGVIYLGCLMPPALPRAAKCSSSISSSGVIGCWTRSLSTEILGECARLMLCDLAPSPSVPVFNLLTLSCVAEVLSVLLFLLCDAANEGSMFTLIVIF